MTRAHALAVLSAVKPELARRFGVVKLALFGSTARDTASDVSDVDVLVTFDAPVTASHFFSVKFFLEEALACPVDLVTANAVRPELRPYIMKESVYV